ncbi:MAG: NADH-quinone oxidoreductase subunit N [Acidimicrobiales bacterium]
MTTFFAAAQPLATPHIEWKALLPTLVLIGGALLLLFASALSRRKPFDGAYALFTVIVALAAIGTAIPLWRDVTDATKGPYTAVAGAVSVDGFSVFLTIVILAAVVLAALLADGFLRREGMDGVELYVLMLLSASGGLIMASANDLIVLFLGLEILSIAVYVLAAMHLRKSQSQEAGVKYFVLGAFSSAFFLYGIALVYGATGTTNLTKIAAFVPSAAPLGDSVTPDQLVSHTPALLLAGFALLVVGFGFKAAVAPFHSWAPDVYQGAPSPTVAFMASAVKVAAFAGLLRVFTVAFGGYTHDWQPFVYALAVASLVVGSVLAVVQTDVKRMLAYSSINHAGFILLGVVAADKGVSGALFYLAAYTFMVAGSFGVVTVVSRRGDTATSLNDYEGLARRQPLLAFVFAIFLFAQAGVPLTSGFFAKFYVLQSAIDAGYWHLALVAMITAVVSAFLYLRIVVAMYMTDDADAPTDASAPRRAHIPFGAQLALGVAFAATLLIGFLPGPLADSSKDATPAATAPAAPAK